MTYASGQSDFVQFVTQIFSEVHLLAVSWITISLCLIRTSGSYLPTYLPTFAVRDVDLHLHFNEDQCGQMVRLFFNIWPLATMKMRPIMSQICQSKHSILRNKKYIKNLPKTCEILPKWRNCAKSGHTELKTALWSHVQSTIIENFLLSNNPTFWCLIGMIDGCQYVFNRQPTV